MRGHHTGEHMRYIFIKTDHKLRRTEAAFLAVEQQIDHIAGPLSSEQIESFRKTLEPSFDYLYNDTVWVLGLARYFIDFINFSKLAYKGESYIQRYRSLRERYVVPHETLESYTQHLDVIAIERQKPILQAIQSFNSEIESMRTRYIDYNDIQKLKRMHTDTQNKIDQYEPNTNTLAFTIYGNELEHNVAMLNQVFVEEEIFQYDALLSNVDNKSLDPQQRHVVIEDDVHNLTVAGAGSGKTLSVAAKVKYLVEVKKMAPEDILLISYTKKSAEEMQERIAHKLGLKVDVKTFHKLGMSIIADARNKKPTILEEGNNIIRDFFIEEVPNDIEASEQLITFLSCYLRTPVDKSQYDSLGDIITDNSGYDDETLRSKYNRTREDDEIEGLKKLKLTILKETVKSMEEVQIANFLYLNGIEYEYERKYEHETGDRNYREYYPDFYLPDYGIYIEHFGMTRDHKVPWLSPIEETKYLEKYQFALEQHEMHQTKLVDTYSYNNSEGNLLVVLKEKLEAFGVKFYPRDTADLYRMLYLDNKDRDFDGFANLIGTFVGLLKSNKFNHVDIDHFIVASSKLSNEFQKERSLAFLKVARKAYLYYQNILSLEDVIDFNDMINDATDIIANGGNIPAYRYIIIDEFQDISVSRYNLVKAIKDKTGAKLLCVGDDWQSIYRFAGSDLQLFTNFKQYFGSENQLKIENTYRNPQKLIDIAGEFVMRNPMQIRKNLHSINTSEATPITILGYNTDPLDALRKAIEDIVRRTPQVKDIMLIGRNGFDINFIDNSRFFSKYLKGSDPTTHIKYSIYPDIHLFYLTAHRSKGLEADATILINVNNGTIGFPNKISDDPVLSHVLTRSDEYRFGEERRLFYVALTRSKSFVYITTQHKKRSEFVKELIDDFNVPYTYLDKPEFEKDAVACPRCKKGTLTQRESGHRKFVGCSNFPQCDYMAHDISIIKDPKQCPQCGGFIVKRKSSSFEFHGCTNYPQCTFKIYE